MAATGNMFRRKVLDSVYICVRQFASSVDKSSLSKLRKKTGYTFVNCKKALEKCDNDLVQAEKWLHQEAQKEGWAKATKLQGRPMSQGLVGMFQDRNSATLVEVNCETDFVAKNEKFQSLVSKVTNLCHQNFVQGSENFTGLDGSRLGAISAEGKTLADILALEIGNIGENMALRRAAFIRAAEGGMIGTYAHASGKRLERDGCKLGKYCSVVELKHSGSSESNCPLHEVAWQLCQHIVGMSPKSLGDPIEAEANLQAKLVDSNTNTDITENIETDSNNNALLMEEDRNENAGTSQGNIAIEPEGDSVTEMEKRRPQKEDGRLLFQEFMLDSDFTVHEFLKENSAELNNFLRFECGEVLSEDES